MDGISILISIVFLLILALIYDYFDKGEYSRLTMTLYFMRNLGYYITQIYIPSSMIVILSSVSFWIDRQAAPARVTLV
jgi:hypothetical protein